LYLCNVWRTKSYFGILDNLCGGQKIIPWFSGDKNLGFCPALYHPVYPISETSFEITHSTTEVVMFNPFVLADQTPTNSGGGSDNLLHFLILPSFLGQHTLAYNLCHSLGITSKASKIWIWSNIIQLHPPSLENKNIHVCTTTDLYCLLVLSSTIIYETTTNNNKP
jgi:hypothetical protein